MTLVICANCRLPVSAAARCSHCAAPLGQGQSVRRFSVAMIAAAAAAAIMIRRWA